MLSEVDESRIIANGYCESAPHQRRNENVHRRDKLLPVCAKHGDATDDSQDFWRVMPVYRRVSDFLEYRWELLHRARRYRISTAYGSVRSQSTSDGSTRMAGRRPANRALASPPAAAN